MGSWSGLREDDAASARAGGPRRAPRGELRTSRAPSRLLRGRGYAFTVAMDYDVFTNDARLLEEIPKVRAVGMIRLYPKECWREFTAFEIAGEEPRGVVQHRRGVVAGARAVGEGRRRRREHRGRRERVVRRVLGRVPRVEALRQRPELADRDLQGRLRRALAASARSAASVAANFRNSARTGSATFPLDAWNTWRPR